VITKDQYHEALQVNLLQDTLQYWERQKWTSDNDWNHKIEAMKYSITEMLRKITGNGRGFLND
jgi:hypothetical protein